MPYLIHYIANVLADLFVFGAALIGFVALLQPAFPRWVRRNIKKRFAAMKSTNPKFFAGFFYGAIVVVLAIYATHAVVEWKDYRREHLPDVCGNIHYSKVVRLSPDTNLFAMIMDMQVMNNGAPTRLWKWKCTVSLKSGRTLSAEAPQESSGLDDNFTKENYIPSKLFKNPISDGGESGWVLFPFYGTNAIELEVMHSNATFTVTCIDRQGKTVESTYVRK